MSDLVIDTRPELRRPLLIAAWSGWSDAGESATGAIRFMLRRWREERFAHIDADAYYDFTQARPRVRLDNGERVIDWPPNDFTAHKREGDGPDLILFQGIEPHLSWHSYAEAMMEVCREFDVSGIVMLGGLLAEVSHTRPIRITGGSDDEGLRELLTLQPRRGGGYEGPTGIMTVVTNAARDAGIATGSIWANVPHYVNASPNPKATLGLLDRLNNGLGLNLRLHDMEVFVARFDAQVAEEIAKNPEMGDYARRIEDQQDDVDEGLVEANGADNDEPDSEGELPDAADMVDELERFLREQRGQDSGS
ncbi:MAG: PAC2 family protein [Chloroflexota bacterium]